MRKGLTITIVAVLCNVLLSFAAGPKAKRVVMIALDGVSVEVELQ
ncbi:hypothetical protein [Sphingobacterium sp. SYP-B4668]|nr:hypothetical protein [Sphingobacterium sp. SYP-B4668]